MFKIATRSTLILLVGVLLSVLNTAVLARILGVEGRADFYFLFLPLYFAPSICSQGFGQVSIYLGKKEKVQNLLAHAKSILKASLLYSFLWLIGALFISDGYDGNWVLYSLITIFAVQSLSLATYVQAIACLDKTYKYLDVIKIVSPLINVVLLMLGWSMGIEEAWVYILIQIIVRVFESAFLYIAMRNHFKINSFLVNDLVFLQHNNYRVDIWKSSFVSLFLNHTDKIAVLILAAKHEVGLYSVAVGLAMIAGQVVRNITNIIVASVSTSDKKLINKFLGASSVYIIVGVLGILGASLFMGSVIQLIFGLDFLGAEKYVEILLVNVFFVSISWLIAQYFMLTGNSKNFFHSQIVAAAVLLVGFLVSVGYYDFKFFLCTLLLASFSSLVYMFVLFIIDVQRLRV